MSSSPRLLSPRGIVLWTLLLLLVACQPLQESGSDSTIFQADTDRRELRYLVLPNQLEVLLISDPDAEKAAAALDVNVGSRQDPAGRDGLAHFLEHMLFLGTEKYPEAGEYQQFISAHGGSHNAFTAFEHTNYFFDIESPYLEQVLDRFSQFFVAPRFDAAYVEREKNAVHSEYLAKIRDDQRRSLDALQALINPGHPFHGFSVGNLETLADRPAATVRDDLLRFYEAHYSANQMALVVVGPQSLDELEEMVRPRFRKIPNREREQTPIDVALFAEGKLGTRLDIQSINQRRTLTYSWPLPDVRSDYRNKSLGYIANLLGHEGEGSLLSYLKAQGWASGLSAGQGLSYQGGAMLSVSIDLTGAGQEHVDEITTALYQMLGIIREQGVEPWRYQEQRQVAEQSFRYREQSKPIWEASRLAGNLHDYPAEEVIRGDYLMEQFDAQRIRELLGLLTPNRMVMTLLAPDVATDRISSRYQTPFRVIPLASDQLASWRDAGTGDGLRLPSSNPFIAQTLSVEPLVEAQVKPALLIAEEGLNLWFLQDPVFRVPRGNVRIELYLPPVDDGPMSVVLTDLWVRMVEESLNEYAYPAYLAGLGYNISRTGQGIEITLEGFDDKQALLLKRILQALKAPGLEPAVFNRVLNRYQRQLRDYINAPPYNLLMEELGTVLHRNRWPMPVLTEVAERVTIDQVHHFGTALFDELSVAMLVHGNYLPEDASGLAATVRAELLAQATVVPPEPVAVMALPPEKSYRWRRAFPHQDAGLLWYRQAADLHLSTRAALGISAQLLNADFYTRLRTEQQLGYVVMSSAYPIRDLPGMVFLVQSPVAGPAALAEAYLSFLSRWRTLGPEALKPLFLRHQSALAGRLAEAPENLGDATGRYWQDLRNGYVDFDSREQLLAAVQGLTFEEWLQLFRRDVLDTGGYALWLSAAGRFEDQQLTRGQPIGNLKAFKDARRFIEFPRGLPPH